MDSEFPDRLKKVRLAKGLSKAEVGRRLNVTRQAVTQWETGNAEPTSENLRKLAIFLDVSYDMLATGRTAKPEVVQGLQLLGEVAAGIWREVIESQEMELERVPVAPDAGYPVDCQYALRVRGNSINKVAADGAIVVCVDVMGAGITIRDKDLVVVERKRGSLVETTIKRLVRHDGVLELWPESTDPAHQEKLTVGHSRATGDISVKALVIWTAQPVKRGA